MNARAKLKEPITARAPIAISPRKAKPGQVGEDVVSHPTLAGVQEKVSRIINTVEYMAARRQLDKRQVHVAEMLVRAHSVLYGSIGLNQDTTKVSGTTLPGSPPPPSFLIAAERLHQAKFRLYPPVYRIVMSVVIMGNTIDQTSLTIHGLQSKHYKELTGRKLREGLTELADMWIPEQEGRREGQIVGFQMEGARPTESIAGVIKPGKVAHATGRRVFR